MQKCFLFIEFCTREERGLRVFENRVLRRIFGPKRDEVTGMEKTTQRGALCCVFITKYYSGDQVRKTKMGRACSTYWERCIERFSGET
jgi:hypothetical protein